jgi:tRNA-dihydrouridine synthase A
MSGPNNLLNGKVIPVSVAPMMAYTDRHFRYFLRLLSPSALLYTEMITAQALKHADPARWLAFSEQEHPVALQLGGSEPADLAHAATLGAKFGYDEINLNCGCPSDRVQSGRFGACLMAEPDRVAESVRAMREAVAVPVTVKCRIGIEPRAGGGDDYGFLTDFVGRIAAAGCSAFVVHARKAVLGGLSPKENREIPPLQYGVVARLQEDYPDCTFVLNGGIRTVAEVRRHLDAFDGVMLGREVCENPYILAELHQAVVDPSWEPPTRESVIESYAEYVEARLAEGYPLRSMTRHVLGLYAGMPRSRSWRRFLSEQGGAGVTGPQILLDSLRIVRAA